MRIAVSGSIAEDFLLTFPGKFADMILADQLDRLSLSFLADDLTHHRGGVGANITFGMGQLGTRPLLVGSVGEDFRTGYEQWLSDHGVDCAGVHISDKATARFLCTTDEVQSQIATFYAGAMADSAEIDIADVVARTGTIDLLVVSPASPDGMVKHTAEAKALGIPVCADPSQQLARVDGEQVVPLVDGAEYLVCNDYERGLITSKTGWTDEELLGRVGVLVTTHGAKGVTIERSGSTTQAIPAVEPADEAALEPTGAGDAFRSGFLSGLAVELDLPQASELGCAVATMALETSGPQGYRIKPDVLRERLSTTYGSDDAEHIMGALPAT